MHNCASRLIILITLTSGAIGFCATYPFTPATSKRNINVSRTYDLSISQGKENIVFLPALMSFCGATNEQKILRSDFEYSLQPDQIEIAADNLGMPRKYYKLTWNNPAATTIRVQQKLKVALLCRNKLCTKAQYPYPAETLEKFQAYLGADAKEGINPQNPDLDAVCRGIVTKSKNAESIVEGVCDWINNNVEFESGTRYGSDETLTTRKGNCSAMSKLACAMLRKIQIPADLVSGKFIDGDSGHTYIEVYFPDAGWVFYDLSNWERGFKSLDCLMTVGYSYRKWADGEGYQWVDGYFSQEQDAAAYIEPQPVRTRAIRSEPQKQTVLGVQVAAMDMPNSIRIRTQPLRELILNASIPPGVMPEQNPSSE